MASFGGRSGDTRESSRRVSAIKSRESGDSQRCRKSHSGGNAGNGGGNHKPESRRAKDAECGDGHCNAENNGEVRSRARPPQPMAFSLRAAYRRAHVSHWWTGALCCCRSSTLCLIVTYQYALAMVRLHVLIWHQGHPTVALVARLHQCLGLEIACRPLC